MKQLENGQKFKKYERKLVNEVQPNDEAVAIIGYAKEKNASEEFYINDDTGKIQVREIPDETQSVKENTLYKVLGKISLGGDGTTYLAAHIIQDMSDLNYDLYKKTMQLQKKIK